MEKKAFFRLTLSAIALGAAVFAAATPARAADAQLIWSANSAQINQSTEALKEGRYAHVIRFAKEALRSKTSPANHLIARHNLCIAYIADGKRDAAKPFCDLALNAEARYQIIDRDGLVVSTTEIASDATAPTLEAAVRANIARAQGSALAENR